VEHERLVAHNYAVVEATALVYRRLGHDAVRDFHMQLLRPIDIVWVDPETHDLAVSAFLAGPQVSLVDRVSFEVMRRLRIGTAFAFDRDFAREGFELAP
jgi:predicted nucleic acid-binding protein